MWQLLQRKGIRIRHNGCTVPQLLAQLRTKILEELGQAVHDDNVRIINLRVPEALQVEALRLPTPGALQLGDAMEAEVDLVAARNTVAAEARRRSYDRTVAASEVDQMLC